MCVQWIIHATDEGFHVQFDTAKILVWKSGKCLDLLDYSVSHGRPYMTAWRIQKAEMRCRRWEKGLRWTLDLPWTVGLLDHGKKFSGYEIERVTDWILCNSKCLLLSLQGLGMVLCMHTTILDQYNMGLMSFVMMFSIGQLIHVIDRLESIIKILRLKLIVVTNLFLQINLIALPLKVSIKS